MEIQTRLEWVLLCAMKGGPRVDVAVSFGRDGTKVKIRVELYRLVVDASEVRLNGEL